MSRIANVRGFFLKQAHDRIKMKNKMPEIKIGKNRVVIKPKNG